MHPCKNKAEAFTITHTLCQYFFPENRRRNERIT
jgi:hypothetical protein